MEIIPRARWGARYRNGFEPAPVPWQENWAHHSVTIAPDLVWLDANRDGVEDDEAAAMRVLEQIGQDRFGGGISYTAAIPPSGRIYEGHGVDRQGAHTGGRNNIARAVVFVGNYDVSPLTREQIVAAAWLLAYWYRRGWCPRPAFNGGHRQAPNQVATTCPGRYVLAAIPEINRLAAAYAAGLDPQEDELPTAREVVDELLARPVKLWSGDEVPFVNVLRSAQGYSQTLHDTYIVGGDPFGTPIFTDKPGTAEQRVMRVRDVLLELRETARASAAREAAANTTLAQVLAAVGSGGQLDVPRLLADVRRTVDEALAEGVVSVDVEVRAPVIDPGTGPHTSG